MGKIHKLSPALADMIAAGEVVERPASVIKELIENAIDAGATQITVEIKNGGITFMRVTDNGCGMSPEDAPTAFLRHATSKLRCAEDLSAIATMGFRGEALAAISAVSKIDLLTCAQGAQNGTGVRVEASVVKDVSPAGCPQGTTIIVRELFYNTPARMKFLKRDSVEGGYINSTVQRQALSHPEIAFRLIRDGKPELSTPGDGKLLSAIYATMGRQAAGEMVPLQGGSGGITLSGYVGLPSANRGSRSSQHFFVNGRYVKSKTMSLALEEAYRNQMMTGRFPICVIHLQLPPSAVDVNVHPAKTEVKFLREGDVYDAIRYGVYGAIHTTQDRPELTIPREKPKNDFYQTMSAGEYRSRVLSAQEQQTARAFLKTTAAQRTESPRLSVRDGVRLAPGVGGSVSVSRQLTSLRQAKETAPTEAPAEAPAQTALPLSAPPAPKTPTPEPEQRIPQKPEAPPYRIIGQTMDTYILVEQGDNLLLFDKHAAHERILFESLKAQEHEIMSQLLLSPLQLRLDQEEKALLLSQTEVLSRLGFTIEDFGDGCLLVRSVPAALEAQDTQACLEQLSQDIRDGRRLDPTTVYDNLLHTIACKAAIKGGRKTDLRELDALIAQLMSREDIQHCPHGRPVCITLSRSHLERQFKRA